MELPQEPPAFEGGHNAFAEAAELGVISAVTPVPAAQTFTPEWNADSRAGALMRLVRPALDGIGSESGGNAVVPGRG